MKYKSHDPGRQAKSDRFQKGLRDGLRDQLRRAADPPLEPLGFDPEFELSTMYQTGYAEGLARVPSEQW